MNGNERFERLENPDGDLPSENDGPERFKRNAIALNENAENIACKVVCILTSPDPEYVKRILQHLTIMQCSMVQHRSSSDSLAMIQCSMVQHRTGLDSLSLLFSLVTDVC